MPAAATRRKMGAGRNSLPAGGPAPKRQKAQRTRGPAARYAVEKTSFKEKTHQPTGCTQTHMGRHHAVPCGFLARVTTITILLSRKRNDEDKREVLVAKQRAKNPLNTQAA